MSILKLKNSLGQWVEVLTLNGRDGAIQYTAGEGITIDENNVIRATGGGGGITREEVEEMIGAAVPTKLSDLTNDEDFVTKIEAKRPTITMNVESFEYYINGGTLSYQFSRATLSDIDKQYLLSLLNEYFKFDNTDEAIASPNLRTHLHVGNYYVRDLDTGEYNQGSITHHLVTDHLGTVFYDYTFDFIHMRKDYFAQTYMIHLYGYTNSHTQQGISVSCQVTVDPTTHLATDFMGSLTCGLSPSHIAYQLDMKSRLGNTEVYLESIPNYDDEKTQVLKHTNGNFTWVDEATNE